MLGKHQIFGNIGESYAVNFLKKRKYKILATNYKTFFGELDIVAKHKNTYVFVEVKTRASKDFGDPSDAVDKRKQRHIIDSAERFLDDHRLFDVDYRFDIIEVLGEKSDFDINHIMDAFA